MQERTHTRGIRPKHACTSEPTRRPCVRPDDLLPNSFVERVQRGSAFLFSYTCMRLVVRSMKLVVMAKPRMGSVRNEKKNPPKFPRGGIPRGRGIERPTRRAFAARTSRCMRRSLARGTLRAEATRGLLYRSWEVRTARVVRLTVSRTGSCNRRLGIGRRACGRFPTSFHPPASAKTLASSNTHVVRVVCHARMRSCPTSIHPPSIHVNGR